MSTSLLNFQDAINRVSKNNVSVSILHILHMSHSIISVIRPIRVQVMYHIKYDYYKHLLKYNLRKKKVSTPYGDSVTARNVNFSLCSLRRQWLSEMLTSISQKLIRHYKLQ